MVPPPMRNNPSTAAYKEQPTSHTRAIQMNTDAKDPPTQPLVNRSEEHQAITQALLHRQNFHIYGDRGLGKTYITKLAAQNVDTPVIFLNCIQHDTEYKAVAQLYREITSDEPKSGIHTATLQENVEAALTDHNTVILDEVDFHQQPSTLLAWMAEHPNVTVGTISSQHHSLHQIVDGHAVSRLNAALLEFDHYTETERFEILATQAQEQDIEATNEALITIAQRTQNLQLAEIWLTAAATYVDDVVTATAAEQVQRKAVTRYQDELLSDFTPHHHLVLEAVYQLTDPVTDTVHTGEAYQHYRDLAETVGKEPLTSRRVGDYLDHLDLLDLVDIEKRRGGDGGKTRLISLQQPG